MVTPGLTAPDLGSRLVIPEAPVNKGDLSPHTARIQLAFREEYVARPPGEFQNSLVSFSFLGYDSTIIRPKGAT